MNEQINKVRDDIKGLQQSFELKDYGDERDLIKQLIQVVTRQQTIIEKLASGNPA